MFAGLKAYILRDSLPTSFIGFVDIVSARKVKHPVKDAGMIVSTAIGHAILCSMVDASLWCLLIHNQSTYET